MDDLTAPAKMSGYLEKKGKMKMVSTWKKHWFVLEGRLLLYYRSKDEYDALSKVKGSINLGPPCTIKSYPSMLCVFQIQTRSSTITLRTDNDTEMKKWMHALMLALKPNHFNQPELNQSKLNHFRYSLDDLVPKIEQKATKKILERQRTYPNSTDGELIVRFQKLGAQSYNNSINGSRGGVTTTSTISLVENDLYNIAEQGRVSRTRSNDHIYQRASLTESRQSFIVDNDNYSTVSRQNRRNDSILIENDQYGDCTTALYDEPRENFENQYEAVDYNIDDGPIYEECANSTLAVTTRPKKIKKSESFIRKVFKKKAKRSKSDNSQQMTEKIYEEIDDNRECGGDRNDGNTLQLLSELQTKLETKKSELKETLSRTDSKHISPSSTPPKGPECIVPTLPPKITKTLQVINQNEPVRSIDEILDDLNGEKIELKKNSKVKLLIEKFSESEDDSDVVLRKKSHKTSRRHSDELYRLLNELSKVTTAPVLPPGVTNSLVNPILSEEEWLKMLPIRQRRLSEPDYDIPRPHKSITLQPKSEPDAIPATRFFGPVLTSSPALQDDHFDLGMTPDSLEIDSSPKTITYQSHHYEDVNTEVIYALPKPYIATHIVNTCRNICRSDLNEDQAIIYKNVRNLDRDEVFIDSLELSHESLTEF